MALPEKIYVKNHYQLATQLDTSFPRTAFAGATLDHLFTGENIDALDASTRSQVIAFIEDFLTCDCSSKPYCGHPEERFCRWVLEARLEGHSPEAIVDQMGDLYHLYAYSGDVLNYLDDAIRRLEAIAALAHVEGRSDHASRAKALARALERGRHPS